MAVLIYAENWEGKFKKLSFELASYGAQLAGMIQSQLVAVSIGEVAEEELLKLGNYGVSKVISLNHPQLQSFDSRQTSKAIAQVAEQVRAVALVLSTNNSGKALAPRLAVRLKAGIASGVNQLPTSISPFVVNKKVFSGGAFASLTINSKVKILTLLQNSFELKEQVVSCTIEHSEPILDNGLTLPKVLDSHKHAGKILLSDAEIVVSGGRGMKSADNWAPLLELAELLNAATACSRPISDEGWRPHDEHTGQTGKIIAPNLYIAIGISGATQHIAGVSSSKCIVAINNDKSAPIFESAQYGIVGDAAKVLPKLTEALKAIKNK